MVQVGRIQKNRRNIFITIQSKLLTDELKKDHEEVFLSIKQKGWSLNWYFKLIQNFNPAANDIMTDPGVISPTPTQKIDKEIDPAQLTISSGTITINNPILTEKDKLFIINLLFDGFIWNTKSVLDCFAHGVRFIYSLGGYSKKRKLHIDDLPNILENNHKDKNLTKLLKNIKKENWYKQLNNFRDITTHKNAIPKEIEYTTKERSKMSLDVPEIKTREGKIFLKKDPKNEKSEEIDLKVFTRTLYNNARELIKNSYSAIYRDIEKEKKLPLSDNGFRK